MIMIACYIYLVNYSVTSHLSRVEGEAGNPAWKSVLSLTVLLGLPSHMRYSLIPA